MRNSLGVIWRGLDEHAIKIDERKTEIAKLQQEETQDKEDLMKIKEKIAELLAKNY